jgi:hypothetical protein
MTRAICALVTIAIGCGRPVELPRATPIDRARAYGELLATCVACHAGEGGGGAPTATARRP